MRRDRSHQFSGVRECLQEVGCLALITDTVPLGPFAAGPERLVVLGTAELLASAIARLHSAARSHPS
ncbi:MAG: hypothetical protein K0Q60_4124 [Microvirga sp.]|nr:hypothetical protein [Microvirga sp.]